MTTSQLLNISQSQNLSTYDRILIHYPSSPLHLPLLLPLLLLLLHLLVQLVGWAAADSDWSGRTWGSPYAIAVMDIEGFVQENQAGPGGPGGSKFIRLDHSYVFSLYLSALNSLIVLVLSWFEVSVCGFILHVCAYATLC